MASICLGDVCEEQAIASSVLAPQVFCEQVGEANLLQKWVGPASFCLGFLLAPLQTLPVFAKVWKSVGLVHGRVFANKLASVHSLSPNFFGSCE